MTEDDREVMFALEMALEQDLVHQALALVTWMPRIKIWYERALLGAGYRDQLIAAPVAAVLPKGEQKWCSWCKTDTHNDPECWSTRPAIEAETKQEDVREPVSIEAMRQWNVRHDLGISSDADLRCAFEDAATLAKAYGVE